MNAQGTAALLEISQSALRCTAPEALVREALETLRSVTSCGLAALYATSPSGPALTLQDAVRGEGDVPALASVDPFLAEAAAARDPRYCERGGDSGTRSDAAVAVRTDDGTYGVLTISAHGKRFTPADGELLRELAATLAMSIRAERCRLAAQSNVAESRYVFEHYPNPMLILDAQTFRYIDVNQTAVDTYGYTREQFREMTAYDLRAPGHTVDLDATFNAFRLSATTTVDTVHRCADGRLIDVHITSITVERDGRKVRVASVQDMTERNDALARALQSERQLEHDVLHDRMTGLANRSLLSERLTTAIVQARTNDRMMAVLFIDLDKFKDVNDSLGHSAGDTVLKEIAARLRSSTRRIDCIARMGGDEFVAVLGDVSDPAHAAEVARHLGQVIAEPIPVPGTEIAVTCSIGVAVFPRDGGSAETLIRNADIAMYEAKRGGRGTARYYTASMHHADEQRLRLEARLRKALADDAFELAYQPIYGMDGAPCAGEALIRWPQPDGTVMQPGAFIPFAEESGLIVPIGAWVLRSACEEAAGWNRSGRPLCVNVNVSAKQLSDPYFVHTVRSALRESDLPPGLLELELTDTLMVSNVDRTAGVLRELRTLGVRIAIDDFGTGYNSLAALRAYTVDTLKLDTSFVAGIGSSTVDQAIASTVIFAAHALGAKVVAEGVETSEQHAMLATLQCDAAQGYLLGRPMSAERFRRLVSLPRERATVAGRALLRAI